MGTAPEGGVPGVSDDRILFGQSAAFSGPSQQLGTDMRLGLQAAFHEVNEAGGVNGRLLELTTLDDAYETEAAFDNAQRLINSEGVFALIGAVGTPTSRASVPVAATAGVPFVAPFTGAEFLRSPELDNVLNLRASYYQETEEIVARLTEDLGITRVAVLHQNDSYGATGLTGTELALERRGLEPVATGYYRRNTTAVKSALLDIAAGEPEAVVMIGAYAPVAEMISLARSVDADLVFATVSFVGSNALSEALGPEGAGVYVTQVVPLPGDTDVPVVAAYQEALASYDDGATPSFVSLEGYLAGRLAILALEGCGSEVSRECFLNSVRDAGAMDIEGFPLQYGPDDNQGSDTVLLTVIGEDGEYHPVERMSR
ncbi:ABC transporter substrate-binding protein [Candidatus Poriferisocius sp.]|uniref:ABC transporter substrate-binding protein n=1 Tax=Candidatus Poriferisocius sp. TaxID=3101276 RepID=UPI003B5A2318